MQELFMIGKGIVPALDITNLQKLLDVATATHDIPDIVAYTIGGLPAEAFGLPLVVATIRGITDKHLNDLRSCYCLSLSKGLRRASLAQGINYDVRKPCRCVNTDV